MLLEQTEEGRGQLLMEVGEQLDVMLGKPLLLRGSSLDHQHLQTPACAGPFISLE